MKKLFSLMVLATTLPAILRAQHSFDQILPATEGLAMVVKGGKAGFVNREGKEVVPPVYDGAFLFSEGRAVVSKDKKLGFIDKEGRVVIEPRYEAVGFHGGDPIFYKGFTAARLNKKWGVIDRSGKVVVPFRYDIIYGVKEGMAYVQCGTTASNMSFGLVNERGEEVVPCGAYVRLEHFSEGLAAVKVSGSMLTKNTDRWGFVDRTGKLVIPAVFTRVTSFAGGYANVEQDGQRFFIDKTGHTALRPDGDISYYSFGDGLCAIENAAGKIGFIDTKGVLVIDHQFETVPSPFYKGVAAVKKGGLYGLIDKKGNVLAPFRYRYISEFSEDLAQVTMPDGGQGYIDLQGKVLLEPKYREAGAFRNGEAIIQNQKGNWLTIDRRGFKTFDSVKVAAVLAGVAPPADKKSTLQEERGSEAAPTKKVDRAALMTQLKSALAISTSKKYIYKSGSARVVSQASLKEEGGKLVYRIRSQYDGLNPSDHSIRFDPKRVTRIEFLEGKDGSDLDMITLHFSTDEVEQTDGTYKDWKTMMKQVSVFFSATYPIPLVVSESFKQLKDE